MEQDAPRGLDPEVLVDLGVPQGVLDQLPDVLEGRLHAPDVGEAHAGGVGGLGEGAAGVVVVVTAGSTRMHGDAGFAGYFGDEMGFLGFG